MYDMFMFHWQLVHARCVFRVLVLVALEAAGHMHVSVEASCVFQIGLYICQTYTGLKGYIHIGKEFYLYHGHL